jgi:antitoxin component YwqK of YwqJK toxin-antitoxin module
MLNKTPYNNKGQAHGIWEVYYPNGQFYYKGTYVNGVQHGLWITYLDTGELCYKGTYNMGQLDGICQWFNRDGSLYKISFYAR